MRPKKHETTGSGDLFRAQLDQIINMRHELVQLAGKIDWDFIDGEIAPLYSDSGRPGIATRFVIGLFLLKHTRLARKHGVRLRQSYLRIAKRAAMMAGRYAHAKQFNRYRRQLRVFAHPARPAHSRHPS